MLVLIYQQNSAHEKNIWLFYLKKLFDWFINLQKLYDWFSSL